MFLKEPCPDDTIKNSEELKYVIRIEIAAPIVPYIGTKRKKVIKKVTICKSPLNTSNLDLFKLLSFDIRFAVIEAGIMAIASITKTVTADSYSGPIKESIDLGATSKATTIGDIRLRLSLRLLEDRSFFKEVEEGITI